MKSRDNTIDSVAGVMIVYMVFTHVCQHFGLVQSTLYLSLERVLYFFMPWFFFKAGMFFSLKDDKEVVRASASRLLKPFIIYTLLGHAVYVIVCAVKGNLALSVLFPVRQLVLNGSITGNLPLWFLLTLFICRILLNLIGKTKGRVLALCLLSLVAAFLMHLANFDHPYYLANTMTGLTFMCLGYIVKKNYPPPGGGGGGGRGLRGGGFSPQSHYMPSPFYTRLLLGCGQTPSITAIIWLGYWGQWQASLS